MLLVLACASPPAGSPAPDPPPCPDVGPGLAAEETAAFEAGDHGTGVVVLMGGGVEVDRASARFVDAAGGGDVLVLRATGSTSSYTSYFSGEDLDGITTPARAVATVRVDEPAAGADEGLLCRVDRADAVWLAGGDQADYLLDWPPALHAALARAVDRGAAIGGTSAGAMSWSEWTYDGRDGGMDSAGALADPSAVSVTRSPFAAVPGAVVDTHFSQRDREGRLIVFAALAGAVGVGLDEGAALVLGGDAAILSDGGGAAFYAVSDADTAGPLSATVSRVDAGDGEMIPFPPSFSGAETFEVDRGVVRR